MNLIEYFMSGQIILDFGNWIWNGMLLGWTQGIWEWHQRVSEVPWPLYIDSIFSFCVAVFLIACIWCLLSIIFASFWVGLTASWLFIWAVWLIILFVKWFAVEILWTIVAWTWPFVLTCLGWLWSIIFFFVKWIVILFFPGIIAAALLTVIYENYGGINNIWYVWLWIALTASIAIIPIGWFIWHYSVLLLFFFGVDNQKSSKTSS